MAYFHFQKQNTHFMLSNGRKFTNGLRRIVEVDDSGNAEVCTLLRKHGRGSGVQEMSSVPHESLSYYAEESNDGAEYPLPEMEGARVVVIGRGLSSLGYGDRYGDGYVTCGVNPASIPLANTNGTLSDPTDGIHAGDYSFDCIASLDHYYYDQGYVGQYKGPVIGPEAHRSRYRGCGTYHAVSHMLPHDPELSFGLALLFATTMGASDIILCGCDMDGDYSKLRVRGQAIVEEMKKRGARVWIDKENHWKPIGVEVWNGC